jgi:hypothetical protein
MRPQHRFTRNGLTLAWLVLVLANAAVHGGGPQRWTIDNAEQWQRAHGSSGHVQLTSGRVQPTDGSARFESDLKRFAQERRAATLTFEQPPAWNNWRAIDNVGPPSHNAPVFLPVTEGEYWYLAQDGSPGYTAWRSTDMENWTKHGQVTKSKWVTTAEYANGQYYIYYDEPNDQDPHLVVHDDLTQPDERQNHGEVFADPSDGSDAGILRDDDGTFHLIYEDWSPINARQHSWDSPLAGHSISEDGVHGFEPHETTAPIDERTTPLPEFGTYRHPSSGKLTYHKHQGPQDAFGDFTQIKIGERYYLFCDYDPHDAPMRVGYWSSDDINDRFTWEGSIGKGFHPDPTIGFAEGRFYLIVQRNQQDFVSPGPWVKGVEARAGVDTDGDGQIDQWTDWQSVRETYSRKDGFARVIEKSPAALDLTGLPAGTGFKFAFRLDRPSDSQHNARPIIDRVTMSFEPSN